MPVRLDQIVIDCADPSAAARFWARLLGGRPVDRDLGWAHVEAPGLPKISFQPVPEPKAVKNRLHLDLEVDDIVSAVAQALQWGASRHQSVVSGPLGSYQVMYDPWGNEFCFVTD